MSELENMEMHRGSRKLQTNTGYMFSYTHIVTHNYSHPCSLTPTFSYTHVFLHQCFLTPMFSRTHVFLHQCFLTSMFSYTHVVLHLCFLTPAMNMAVLRCTPRRGAPRRRVVPGEGTLFLPKARRAHQPDPCTLCTYTQRCRAEFEPLCLEMNATS